MALFTLETDRLRLAWHGRPAPEDPSRPAGVLAAQALRGGGTVRVEAVGGEAEEGGHVEVPLWLAEQTPYRVFARSLTAEPLRLLHEDPPLLAGIVSDDGGRVLSGPLDFRGEVGRSVFTLEVGGEPELRFSVGVAPTKATAAEVEAMRAEVDEALAGLALEYLRSARLPAAPFAGFSGRASWLTLLRRALPDLEAALAVVARHPLRDLRRELAWQRAERVRRPDAVLHRALRAGRGAGPPLEMGGGMPLRTTLPASQADLTLDTPEHRWLRTRLEDARRTVGLLHREERALPATARRRQTLNDLADAERRLARLLRLEPLRAAERGGGAPTTPRLFTTPGYAEAYEAASLLTLGLSIGEGPFPHATKDLPLLYEGWTYLATLRELAALLGEQLPPRDFFKADHRGVRLLLRRGHRHAVRFQQGGLQATLTYNPRLSARLGLLVQRPDLLLVVERDGSEPRWLLLDAKYRRDDSAEYVRRYGAPGPPEDALGDLHRYRDAIVVGQERPRRAVEAAVALYPYRAEASFEASRLWASVGRLGIGAVPLLPGQTEWLRRWLEAALAG